jgi:predicted nucleotide-binding protein
MIKSDRLEWALLRAIANASDDDWVQLSLSELRNRLKEIDASAATEKINIIADAFISLGGEQALLMRKYDGGGRPQQFDFQRQNDEGYTSTFFSRDHFEVKLMHEGRKRVTEPAAGVVPVRVDPSRITQGYDQHLADEILRILNERFPVPITVDQLRTDLPEFATLDQPKWYRGIDALVRDGLVECKILRSGYDSIEDAGPLRLTQEGRRRLQAAAPVQHNSAPTGHKVFIGHGRSPLWRDLKDFIADRLHLDWEEFNRESAAGLSTKERLQAMLDDSGFALLVLTAEDERPGGSMHARDNVVHELGLFQGRLGFERAIILLEEGCAEFSNIHGLTHIAFPKGNIKAISEEIRRVLEREGVLLSDKR